MLYKVKASLIEGKEAALYRALTDGSVANQKPDGAEIVASMKRASITGPNIIEWAETCYCSTPLAHERATVLDNYFTNLSTETAEKSVDIEGDSLWQYLENEFDSPASA